MSARNCAALPLRLEMLPCAKMTRPFTRSGTARSPSTVAEDPIATSTGRGVRVVEAECMRSATRRRLCNADACRCLSAQACALEQFFHDHHVHPPAVELSVLAVDANVCEAGAPVERNADFVGGHRCEDHLVVPDRSRVRDQRFQQLPPEALAAALARDVD